MSRIVVTANVARRAYGFSDTPISRLVFNELCALTWATLVTFAGAWLFCTLLHSMADTVVRG